LATLFGKFNPFRIRIDSKCDKCWACGTFCRYDALSKKNIGLKIPASSCTLCGDCVNSCHANSISYTFLGFRGAKIKNAFIILIVIMHSVFLACARI